MRRNWRGSNDDSGAKQTSGSAADLVAAEWPGMKLRVTEAWDEDMEHGDRSKPGNQPAKTRITRHAVST